MLPQAVLPRSGARRRPSPVGHAAASWPSRSDAAAGWPWRSHPLAERRCRRLALAEPNVR